MKTNHQITAALLAATLAAAGCSSSDETLRTKTQDSNTARVSPVSMTNAPADSTPKITGPVSFADAEAAYQAGNYSDAATLFELYTAQQPNNPWGHFMLGLSSSKSGDPAKAEEAFEQALRLDLDHVKSLTNLSRVLIEQGRFDDAFVKLTQAAEIDPGLAEVHRLMGRTFYGQGRMEDAMAAYRQAIALDGQDAWSLNNLGFLFLEQGRPGDAAPLLARAVELQNDVPTFHNNLGMALEHTGRFTAAASEYRGALAVDPNYEKAQRNLARVEAVKVESEEPFDLAATASRYVEQTQIPVVETAPEQ
jgi:Flp pilus assembly protein TadD